MSHRTLIPLLVAALLGCMGVGTPDPDPVDDPVEALPRGAVSAIRAAGPPGAGPTHLVVATDGPLFPADWVDALAPEGTVLTLQPPLEGALRVASRDTLVFTPEGGFAPGTEYVATLTGLATPEAVVEPPHEGAWSHTFRTPAFAFSRLAPARHDPRAGELEVELVFTAPVDPGEVRDRAAFSVEGRALTPRRVSEGDGPHAVRFAFRHGVLRDEGTLALRLAAGVPLRGLAGHQAPAAEGSVEFKPGEPVDILATMVKEGSRGHYLEVICRDRAVEGTRWHWDRELRESFTVSPRCQLDPDELRTAVHITPSAGELDVAAAPAGFRIFGDFSRGTYRLRLDAGARTLDGGVLPEAHEAELEVPLRSPNVEFMAQGRYLPRAAWTNLPIRHRNAERAELTVRHVPAENLVFWLSGEEPATTRTSNLVLKRSLALTSPPDADQTTWLDVGGLLPQVERGVYELTVAAQVRRDEASSTEQDTGWWDDTPPVDEGDWRTVATATSRLLLTDLQLVAKAAAPRPGEPFHQAVHVWALESHTNQPASGVEVRLVRPSGQALATCRTAGGGGCTLRVPQDDPDPTPPFALVASRGDDLTYLRFRDVEITPAADVQGVPYHTEAPFRAAVMTDRGVYRPGDVARLTLVVRDRDHHAPEDPVPVVVKLHDPGDREIRRLVATTNASGLATLDVPFADFAPTGRWRLRAEVGDERVGEAEIKVEEFVPERMSVQLTPAQTSVLADTRVRTEIEARWLFGGSAEGARVELTCALRPAPFVPRPNDPFRYGPLAPEGQAAGTLSLGTVRGALDEDGRVPLDCPAPSRAGGYAGPTALNLSAAVFEGASGRTSHAEATVQVHPERYYLGARGPQRLTRGQQATIEGTVVDWQGAAATGPDQVQVEVYRLEYEYGWIWDEREGTTRRRQARRVQEVSEQVPVRQGRFQASFTPGQAENDHLVVFTAGKARTELLLQGSGFRYWAFRADDRSTPRPQQPGVIRVELPQVAHVGDRVPVKLQAPFAGRLLLTVETDEVVEHHWRDVEAGEVDWQFRLRRFTPTAYVTALLLKDPHLESAQAWLPERAFGAAPLRVEPEAWRHDLRLSAPAEVRPHQELEVEIDLGRLDGPAHVTVAAVDEGILSLTRFQDPDPLAQIFRKRALGVRSFETVGWTVLMPPGGPSGHTGGDADAPPARVQMVRPVALWSGEVEVPASGKATVRFQVPGYRGQLRVMAVSADARRMGSASTQVVVRDPLTLQTTLPRFLVSGDTATVPVTLTNLTGSAQDVALRIEASDLEGHPPHGLTFPEGTEGRLQLGPDQTGTVLFRVEAGHPGAARLRVTATAGRLSSHEELELPIGTPHPEVRQVTRTLLARGANDLSPYLDDWVPGTDRTSVWVTTNPYGPAFAHLGYLVRYPYGCLEQLTSSTRPLLFVRSLMEQVDPDLVRDQPVDRMVARGIERILAMQAPGGGFGTWPGATRAHAFNTAYATHLLLDARDEGYPVPARALDEAVAWLGREADRTAGHSGLPDTQEAYLHYVLARAGQGRAAVAARRLDRLDRADPARLPPSADEARYLLQAAMHRAGDRRHEAALKRLDTSPVRDLRTNDWTYYSDLRKRAFTLAVFYDLFGADPAGQPLADLVAEQLQARASHFYTTQELAWAVTALGRWTGGGDGRIEATLSRDGRAIEAHAGQGGHPSWTLHRATLADSLSVDLGRGSGQAWAVITTEGNRGEIARGAQGVELTREVLASDGRRLVVPDTELGEALYVRLTLTNRTDGRIQNLAMVDRLPAGWEIENPRLGRGELPDWVNPSDLWSAEHMNLRDDRVEVFGTLERGQSRSVVYLVRAVTAGSFTQPEAYVEAMYDPRVRARLPGGTVRVKGPWDGS